MDCTSLAFITYSQRCVLDLKAYNEALHHAMALAAIEFEGRRTSPNYLFQLKSENSS